MSNSRAKTRLIIIGGHEDKEHDEEILTVVAKEAIKGGKLVIVTAATQYPEEVAKQYTEIFKKLGVKHISVLDIRTREDGHDLTKIEMLKQAQVIFFTGGDQLRITSQIADSPVYQCMQQMYEQGITIAGTSAGAAVMPATMLISGASDESSKVSALGMAPGLGLINNVVIDTHFAERGRMGRLLGAVTQNPATLGIGIDENTAIVVEDHTAFTVIGSGAVYVVDGSTISYSSLSQKNPEGIVTIHDVRLHVLGKDDRFDLQERRPIETQPEA